MCPTRYTIKPNLIIFTILTRAFQPLETSIPIKHKCIHIFNSQIVYVLIHACPQMLAYAYNLSEEIYKKSNICCSGEDNWLSRSKSV